MNAAWGSQSDYGEVTFFLGKHKTTKNLKKTGAFTVAFGTVETVTISDYFGVETGNRVNKIEKAGVHVHKSAHVNAPIITHVGEKTHGFNRQDASPLLYFL